jgi:hypothetical protein
VWAAWVIATIALVAIAFMLWFLIALLRESAPSVCYWVVPTHPELKKEGHLNVLSGIYFDDDCGATKSGRGDYGLELMENENYGKEKRASDLIALDVRVASDGLGWRSIHPKRGYFFRQHRL